MSFYKALVFLLQHITSTPPSLPNFFLYFLTQLSRSTFIVHSLCVLTLFSLLTFTSTLLAYFLFSFFIPLLGRSYSPRFTIWLSQSKFSNHFLTLLSVTFSLYLSLHFLFPLCSPFSLSTFSLPFSAHFFRSNFSSFYYSINSTKFYPLIYWEFRGSSYGGWNFLW